MKILLVLVMLLVSVIPVSATPEWSAPRILQSCEEFTVKWYDPPVPMSEMGDLLGQVWFIRSDGLEEWYWMEYRGDATLSVKIPDGTKSISWARVWGENQPHYLGVMGSSFLKCDVVYIPLINRK